MKTVNAVLQFPVAAAERFTRNIPPEGDGA